MILLFSTRELTIATFLLPLVLFIGYLIQYFVSVVVTKFFFMHIDKRHPVVAGAVERDFEENIKFIQYHNWKNFMYRIIKFKITHSPFPYLVNWSWNFLGLATIEKNSVLEDIYHPHELTLIEEGAYVGPASKIISQTVEGAVGRIVFKDIKISRRACLCTNFISGPGNEFGEYLIALPNSAVPKNNKMRGFRIYQGAPPYRLTEGRAKRIFFPTEEMAEEVLPDLRKLKKEKKARLKREKEEKARKKRKKT